MRVLPKMNFLSYLQIQALKVLVRKKLNIFHS